MKTLLACRREGRSSRQPRRRARGERPVWRPRWLRLERLEDRRLLSIGLPEPCPVDPPADRWDGQIMYLDLDGERDVRYDGPVTIKGLDVPPFRLPDVPETIAEDLVDSILTRLNGAFADRGVRFVTETPPAGTAYSTIYVGGDDAAFAGFGSFLGLAEKIDVGNLDPADNALVFSEKMASCWSDPRRYAGELSRVIAHEAGHLIGLSHTDHGPLGSIMATIGAGGEGPLAAVAHATATHQHLVTEAMNLINGRYSGNDALWDSAQFTHDQDRHYPVGTYGWYLWWAVEDEDVLAAPWGGDYYDFPWPFNSYDGNYPMFEHFYEEDSADGLRKEVFGLGIHAESALERGEIYWSEGQGGYTPLIDQYKSGNSSQIADAWYYVGRLAHLIQDMTVPAHVHNDAHAGLLGGDDNYEDYMVEYDDDLAGHFNYRQWDAGDVTGSVPTFSSLNSLFNTVAEITDNFDSDGVDGEFPQADPYWDDINWGEVDYEYCQIYGNTLIPNAIKYTASLFRMFSGKVRPTVGIAAPASATDSVTVTASPDGAGTMGIRHVQFQYSTSPGNPSSWSHLATDTNGGDGWKATQNLNWLDYGDTVYYRARALDRGGLYSQWQTTFVVRSEEPPQVEGTIWNDLDGDGSREAGEPGLEGWTAFALQAGQRVATATTDAAGHFEFVGLPAGEYLFGSDGRSGWVKTSWVDYYAEIVIPGQTFGGKDFGYWIPPAEIRHRQVFYNHSIFDDPQRGLSDDQALAGPEKAPLLLPLATATFQNYTSYEKGINGIMVDVAGAHAPPTRADFEFHVGNDDYPAGWGPAPNPVEFSVRPGQGAGNSDRVTITWEDRAIKNTWLQVRVKAERLGLRQDDVFYFGNAPGETGDSADNAIVNTTDELLARSHTRGPRHPAAVDDPYDHNRDGLVNATDRIIARDHRTGPGDALRLITAPGSLGGGAEGVAAADPVEPDVRAAPPAAAVHDRVLQRAAGGETGRRNTPPGKLAWLADFEWIGHPQRHAKKRPSVQQDVDKLVAGDGP